MRRHRRSVGAPFVMSVALALGAGAWWLCDAALRAVGL